MELVIGNYFKIIRNTILKSSSCCFGSIAAAAENFKRRKYNSFDGNYIYEPFEVETLGSWGPSARVLFKELAAR